MSSFNGSAWSAEGQLSWGRGTSGVTQYSPAIATYGQLPIVAWTTRTGPIDISLGAAHGWNKPKLLLNQGVGAGDVHTSYAPALGDSALNNDLHVAWTNGDGSIGTLIDDPITGTPADEQTVPSASTGAAPAIASSGEAVYLAWSARTTGALGYSTTWTYDNNFHGWTKPAFEPQATTHLAPCLAVNGFDVTLGWTAAGATTIDDAAATTPY